MSDPRTYNVRHTTRYRYTGDVSVSYGRAHLLPRVAPGQEVLGSELTVDPAPDEVRDHVDFFGNVSTYYAVRTPHRTLQVTARSQVRVDRPAADVDALDRTAWEQALEPGEAAFVLASPAVALSAEVHDYAAQSFTAGRGFGSALRELATRIHDDFTYTSGATTVNTTLAELMRRRRGVCQDFAHLAIGCLRSLGVPARYVSGYLETDPPPGQPKLQGADASHAWAAALAPGAGWIDLDPTNDQFADSRYVALGWGRDYSDVPPLKGVILTDATRSSMRVGVDVLRVD